MDLMTTCRILLKIYPELAVTFFYSWVKFPKESGRQSSSPQIPQFGNFLNNDVRTIKNVNQGQFSSDLGLEQLTTVYNEFTLFTSRAQNRSTLKVHMGKLEMRIQVLPASLILPRCLILLFRVTVLSVVVSPLLLQYLFQIRIGLGRIKPSSPPLVFVQVIFMQERCLHGLSVWQTKHQGTLLQVNFVPVPFEHVQAEEEVHVLVSNPLLQVHDCDGAGEEVISRGAVSPPSYVPVRG